VLDKVDASLDEANNERFNRIVREFLTYSQFLIITHSKRTMTIADVMHGVTMQEAGVSKRVSVHSRTSPPSPKRPWRKTKPAPLIHSRQGRGASDGPGPNSERQRAGQTEPRASATGSHRLEADATPASGPEPAWRQGHSCSKKTVEIAARCC